eukprot:6488389-Pyramimonas_sp.AAC.1
MGQAAPLQNGVRRAERGGVSDGNGSRAAARPASARSTGNAGTTTAANMAISAARLDVRADEFGSDGGLKSKQQDGGTVGMRNRGL